MVQMDNMCIMHAYGRQEKPGEKIFCRRAGTPACQWTIRAGRRVGKRAGGERLSLANPAVHQVILAVFRDAG